MSTSPLQFAKDFGKLKSDLASQPAADLKLLLLVYFWPSLETHHDDKAYRSYFDEYIPLLLHLISEENLHDLTLPELQGVLNTLRSVKEATPPDGRAETQDKIRLTTICLAKMLFYVGCVEEGVKLCAELVGKESGISSEFNELGDLSEFGALKVVCDRFKDKRPELHEILKSILDAWEGEREALSHERANCLFVEKADQARSWRGRLRVLVGSVETYGKQKKGDDVTFENQIKSPDDPFIGVAYDSLEAVRQVFKAEGFKDKAGAFYHAHFSIRAGGAPGHSCTHTFTGDSIGLAVGLVTYTQLLKPEIMRQERFLAGDVAFTGGVSKEGRLTPVNKSSLACKVERTFFSPVKYLVLPESNLEAAKQYVEKMRQRLPRRRLHLIPADRLTEVIENHNVIRAEKVCMGEFVVRKVYRYSRMTKVQVPLLAGLLLVLLAILFPKWTPWFDHNPAFAISNPNTNSLEAYNRDSTLLWADVLSCPISKVTSDVIWATSFGQIYDFNSDGRNEIVFLPRIDEICDDRGFLRFYSHDGRLLWKRNGAILGRCPVDTTGVQYDVGPSRIVETSDGPAIVSIVYQEMPARSHIRLWNAAGDSLGWYIHWGHGAIQKTVDMAHDGQEEILFTGFNNMNHCVALLVLRPDSIQGFSPIEPGTENEYSWWIPGNQAAYILIPKSDVGCLPGELPSGYNAPGPTGIRLADDGQIQVHVSESVKFESTPSLIYTIDHRCRVVKVAMNDCLATHRRQLVAEGKLQPIEDARAYFGSLRDNVTYWTDSGWVTEGQLRASESLE